MNTTLKIIIVLISVITLPSCKRTFYADNGDNIKKELLNKIATYSKLNDTIRLYNTLVRVCGNDNRYNRKKTKYPKYIKDFYPSQNTYTIKNKKILFSRIHLSDEENFKKNYPQSLKIKYEIKENKVTYIINKNKYVSFNIIWKLK